MTEPELHSFFTGFAKVVRVLVVNDSATGQPRDFCFVDLEGPAARSASARINGALLRGRLLEAIEAVSPSGWQLGAQ